MCENLLWCFSIYIGIGLISIHLILKKNENRIIIQEKEKSTKRKKICQKLEARVIFSTAAKHVGKEI